MKHRILFVLLALSILTLAAPASAQEQDVFTVSTGGIQLTVDKDFATGVSINELPADDPSFGPGFAEPVSTQIAFSNPPPGFAPESILTIRIYRIADFADYPEHQARQTGLQLLLENRADLTEFMQSASTMPGMSPLPFIPVYPHGAVLQARAEYFETPFMQGVRYITAIAAAIEPFTSRSFIYTWQGVSTDGSVYVSGQAYIDASMFSTEITAFDPAEFQANFPQYLTDSVTQLNAAAPDAFSPVLNDVDAILESLTVTPLI
jgi:hypothetical protein